MTDDLLDRRAQIVLTEQNLLRMLRLPEGSRIRYVCSSVDPPAVMIGVLHPDLPLCDPAAEAPIVAGGTVRVDLRVIDGEIWEKATVTFGFDQVKPDPFTRQS